ncbi:hypothetical protein CU098_006066, partial [Rhizopus stolonifer]
VSGQARTNLFCRPTVFVPSASFTDSSTISESLMSEFRQPTPVNLVQPYIKGSVLTDITDIENDKLLFDVLLGFNENMDQNRAYEDYCGRVPEIRKYLNRFSYRQTILNDEVYLADGAFIKGFPSYPADARIVRLGLDRLPIMSLRLLKEDLESRFSHYEQALDLGVHRSQKKFQTLAWRLPDIERQIVTLQEEVAETDMLRADKFWRKKGENSPAYLKRTITIRRRQKALGDLRDTSTNGLHSDQESKERIVHQFYSKLLSSEANDHRAVQKKMLFYIPDRVCLNDNQRRIIGIDELAEKANPGQDGLPYETLRLMMQCPAMQFLISEVYNVGLNGILPSSWNEWIMVLPDIERQIAALQEEATEIDMLRAGKFWRKKGEKSSGYLKRTIKIRERQKALGDQESKERIVHQFYSETFSSEASDHRAAQKCYLIFLKECV